MEKLVFRRWRIRDAGGILAGGKDHEIRFSVDTHTHSQYSDEAGDRFMQTGWTAAPILPEPASVTVSVCVELLSGDGNWFTAASRAYEKNELQEVAGAAYSHRFQANISTNKKTSALEGYNEKQGGV